MRRIICALLLVCLLCMMGAAAYAETIVLPQELTVVDTEAFCGDLSVTEVVLPEGTARIGSRAFADSGLKIINLPDSLQTIAADAFEGCAGLTATVSKNSYAHTYCVANGIAVDVEGSAPKIVIVTGSTSTSEEEYLAAERLVQAYGADYVVHDTYSDRYSSDIQQTKEMLLAYAGDPDVGAIIVSPSVQGVSSAFKSIKAAGDHAPLLIAGMPNDDPDMIGAAADFVLSYDGADGAYAIMDVCRKWDIDTLVFYSFPRHMAFEDVENCWNTLVELCEGQGISLVYTIIPDPTAEMGVEGTTVFIDEDVPIKMEANAGKKVAFFCTSIEMDAALQRAILPLENAYYTLPNTPALDSGYSASLGLSLAEGGGTQSLAQIARALDAQGAAGRFSTYPNTASSAIMDVAFAYADAYIGGSAARHDGSALAEYIQSCYPGSEAVEYTSSYGTTVSNYYNIRLAPVDFNDYL